MAVGDSPLRDRVIFVEGAPRSGTTWLVTLLAMHPEIAGVAAESHLFDFGVDRLFDNFEFRDPELHGLAHYLDRAEVVDLIRDLCDGVLMRMRSHVCPGQAPPFVVEKTPIAPHQGLDLARKHECYPDAWYLHIVRDREAVVRSLMRAPWMSDRSYANCAALWDQSVGHARAELGDLPRYREVSYEELRADPAETCRRLFEWLGVDSGDEILETVRVLSREPFSDLGAVRAAPSLSIASALAAARRRLVSGARAALERGVRGLPHDGATEAPGDRLSFTFVHAMRERDADTLRSLAARSLELLYRGPDGDLSVRGDEARAALVRIADELFAKRYVDEWWGSARGAPGEWWTATAGKPLWTFMFSAHAGDATRVDLGIGLVLEDDLIRRALIVSAGPLTGRPIVSAPAGEESWAGKGSEPALP